MSRDRKRKQKLRDKRRRLQQLRRRSGGDDLPPDTLLLRDLPGVEKMSEVLGEFLRPELEDAENEDMMRRILTLGTVAWNAALLPPAEREQLLRDTEKQFPANLRADVRPTLEPLIRRKEELFAEHHRAIISYALTFDDQGPYLQVISSLPGEG